MARDLEHGEILISGFKIEQREEEPERLYTLEFLASVRGALSTGAGDFNSFVAPVKLQPLIGSSRKENVSMARKRYQQGSVKLIGRKNKKWVGRYREDVVESDGTTRRIRREVILGSKRDLPTERLARRRLEANLVHINAIDYRPGRVATFEEFIERWKSEVLTTQKPSSARAVRSHLRCYILPELGKMRLTNLVSRINSDSSPGCRSGPLTRRSRARQC